MKRCKQEEEKRGWLVLAQCVCVAMLMALVGGAATAQPLSDHTYSSATIATGSRVYVSHCALCHGQDGTWVPEINLALGTFRTVVTDQNLRDVITTGTADGRMPPFSLTEEDMEGLIAFIRTGFDPDGETIVIGNVERGEMLFNGAGECSNCHRAAGHGPRFAPDLSDIGLIRTPAALQRSLKNPAAALLPINRPVTIVTKDGETIRGRRLNEDTYTVQLIDSNERLRSLMKADLERFDISTTPTHEPTTLSADQVADLLGYLLSLRGES